MTHGISIKSLFSFNSLFPFKASYKGGNLLLFAAWLLFFYTVFSGTLRKWVWGPGQAGNILFFIQLLAPFIFFFLISFSKIRRRFRTPGFFLFFLSYLIIAAFNPKNHTIYHGLFGLLIHLGFWVALISYYQRRDYFELEKLVGFFVIILIAEVVLASVQYSLPEDHILNIKANGKAIDAFVGRAVRVSGTFSYIGGFQVMVTFYGFLIWFLLVLEFPFVLTASVFGLSLYAALMSGSRGSLLMFLFVSGFAFLHTGFLFRRLINVVMTFTILATLLFFFGDNVVKSFDHAYDNFSERVEWGIEVGETEARFQEPFKDVVNFKGKYPIYGIGLGSTYQGANILFGESIFAKEFGYYEGELGRIILEGGFILFFLRILVLFVFLQHSFIPALGKYVIFLFFLGNMVVFNTYQGIFFLFGLILVDRAYYLKAKGRVKQNVTFKSQKIEI